MVFVSMVICLKFFLKHFLKLYSLAFKVLSKNALCNSNVKYVNKNLVKIIKTATSFLRT